MKNILLSIIIGVSLVTLSACATPWSNGKEKNVSADTQLSDSALVMPANGDYPIDIVGSKVLWKASKITATHTGYLSVKSGTVSIKDGALTGVKVVMDMESISSDENISSLVKHLKSADFFDTSVYSESSFESESVSLGTNTGEYLAQGKLTIKGLAVPVTILIQAIPSGNSLEFKGDLVINRLDWGIKYGSGKLFQDLGDKAINDEIELRIVIKSSI